MGALDGTLTFRSYRVGQDVPADIDRIRHNAFTPLKVEDDEPSHGWVPLGRPLSSLGYGEQHVASGFVGLGLRVDRWRLPGAVLKARLAEAKQKLLAKTGRVRLGRAEKEQLALEVRQAMRRETVPAMVVTDVVWDQRAGCVRVFSHSAAVNELAIEIFEDTFGAKLTPVAPYTILDDERALNAEPTLFHVDQAPSWQQRSGKIDLFERIESTRFLGPEFLAWLWWRVETERAVFGQTEVKLEKALTLEGADGRTGVAAAAPACVPEALEAARWGKLPARATMVLHHDAREWRLSLTASTLALGSVKIPAVLGREDDDRFIERLDLVGEAEEMVAELFREFAGIRLDPEAWEAELSEIRKWLKED